jgi:hypothetical protein
MGGDVVPLTSREAWAMLAVLGMLMAVAILLVSRLDDDR